MGKYYIARPTSRRKIRNFANEIRRFFKLENCLEFPVVEVFEFLSNLGLFTFEILPKEDMGNKYGETFPEENHIKIREDIYDKACEGVPFGKSTLAHELYHLFFHKETSISLCRTEGQLAERKTYEDPEWQADCFAGELMVSKELVKDMKVGQVVKKCNVTPKMARCQLDKYRKERINEKRKNTL